MNPTAPRRLAEGRRQEAQAASRSMQNPSRRGHAGRKNRSLGVSPRLDAQPPGVEQGLGISRRLLPALEDQLAGRLEGRALEPWRHGNV